MSIVRIGKDSDRHANATEVTLFLSEDESPDNHARAFTGPEKDYVGDFLRNRIEFEDAQGHLVSWSLIGDPRSTTNSELEVATLLGKDAPARVRVYRLLRLATEIPFELSDVPSP
jgi:hypothetical protein